MYKFNVNITDEILSGKVIYIKAEQSFDFTPRRNTDITILLGYINLGVDSETMKVQQVWGLSPYKGWRKSTLCVPSFLEGNLCVEGALQPGMSYRIAESEKWVVEYDLISGWVCCCEDSKANNGIAVKLANDIIAVVDDEKLKSLWLHPKME